MLEILIFKKEQEFRRKYSNPVPISPAIFRNKFSKWTFLTRAFHIKYYVYTSKNPYCKGFQNLSFTKQLCRHTFIAPPRFEGAHKFLTQKIMCKSKKNLKGTLIYRRTSKGIILKGNSKDPLFQELVKSDFKKSQTRHSIEIFCQLIIALDLLLGIILAIINAFV